jgi:mRNA turnover protein 4
MGKTKKQTVANKEALVEQIQEALDAYAHVYVFAVHNMRVEKMNRVRERFKGTTRFFMGKNKVMAVALGRSHELEYKPRLASVAEHLLGNCALMCSNEALGDVQAAFADFGESDYARSGCVAVRTVAFAEGALPQFAHTMDPYLRKLGMPCVLKRGVITLERAYTVCTAGDVLTPDQAQLLKLLDIKMAEFAFTLTCHWHDGKFQQLTDPHEAQRISVRGRAEQRDDNEDDDEMQDNNNNNNNNNDDE